MHTVLRYNGIQNAEKYRNAEVHIKLQNGRDI